MIKVYCIKNEIGEGFEQEPILFDDDDEIYISPWFPGQETIVTQQKIEE